MRRFMRGVLSILCTVGLLLQAVPVLCQAEELQLVSPSAVLMEGETGEVLFSKNATERLRPASITKVMTLLLIMEAVESGRISLSDTVMVSEHAASMGGSQVYLEENETQQADTLIKCISIASANDASVAMAEHIAGSEESFVHMMNDRAKELGMDNTNFVNCYGLDADDHYSCALDVAIMSRELVVRHPDISRYSTVWMDTFTHVTRKGETTFGLNNTNKLIKSYSGITGLKTGSTSLAKYCLSATAKRDNMHLVAVIMAAPTTKERFSEAAALLNYGFSNYKLYTDNGEGLEIEEAVVENGVEDSMPVSPEGTFSYLYKAGEADGIGRTVAINEGIAAPFEEGVALGEIRYDIGGRQIGSLPLVAERGMEEAGYLHYLKKIIERY